MTRADIVDGVVFTILIVSLNVALALGTWISL